MNVDQLKEKLLMLEPNAGDFLLVFSGKTSKKVHGLYKPETKEIIIHNKNFNEDNGLIYTGIHEFAHHIHHVKYGPLLTNRCHNARFWQIFHTLLKKAEELEIYQNPFRNNPEFLTLTQKIKDNYLKNNAQQMKELGLLLKDVALLCVKNNLFFDDYVDRELKLQHNTAKTIMKISELDLPPEVGFDNMKMISSIKGSSAREEAVQALMEEESSPDAVRVQMKDSTMKEDERETLQDPKKKLQKEKEKIEKTIKTLNEKLEKVEKMIEDLD